MKTNKLEIMNYKNFVGAEHFEPDTVVVIDGDHEIKISGIGAGDVDLVAVYTTYGYAIDCRSGFPKAPKEAERAKAALASLKARKTLEAAGAEVARIPVPEVAQEYVPQTVSLEEALEHIEPVKAPVNEAPARANDVEVVHIIGKISEVPVTRYVQAINREVNVEFPNVDGRLLSILEGMVGAVVEIQIKVVDDSGVEDDDAEYEYEDEDEEDD